MDSPIAWHISSALVYATVAAWPLTGTSKPAESARLCQDGGLVGCALAEFSTHSRIQVQALLADVTQLARDASQGRVAGGNPAFRGRVLQWLRRAALSDLL